MRPRLYLNEWGENYIFNVNGKKKKEVSGFIYDSIHGANMINISALASNHIWLIDHSMDTVSEE